MNFNSGHQVAAVDDSSSSTNICKEDDKSEQSDRGSPEIFIQEEIELDGVEKHRCITCDKVGKMLVCTESGCPIAVHEDCLIPKPYFDDSGNFYCPYCSYKRAVDKVQRLKMKAMAAKEVLSKFLKEPVVDSFGGEEPENISEGSEDAEQNDTAPKPSTHVSSKPQPCKEKGECGLFTREAEELEVETCKGRDAKGGSEDFIDEPEQEEFALEENTGFPADLQSKGKNMTREEN